MIAERGVKQAIRLIISLIGLYSALRNGPIRSANGGQK